MLQKDTGEIYSKKLDSLEMLLVVLLTLFVVTSGQQSQRYIIPLFGLNITEDSNNTDLNLIITSTTNSTVTVHGTATNSSINTRTFNLHTSSINRITLTGLPFLNSSMISDDSLLVESSEDITLQVITSYSGYKEGFMAIPTSSLGQEYYVSTFCALGGYCQITIATTISGTTKVILRLPSNTDEEIVYCMATNYWKSGRDKVITLEYPDTVQVTTRRDLTGSYIYADNPVSVLVGSHSVQNGNNVYHYLEHLIPTEEWGTEFVFKAFGDGSYDNVVAITAYLDETFVSMTGFSKTELSAGQFFKRRVEVDFISQITSTNPIQVVLFTGLAYENLAETTSRLVTSNPGMSLVPALEHYPLSSQIGCLNSGSTVPFIQATTQKSLSFSYYTVYNIHYIPYGLYEIYEIEPISLVLQSPYYMVHSAGILACEETAIMPTVKMVRQTSTCVSNVGQMYPGDELDNNCNGDIDEDYCFENKKLEAQFYTMDGQIGPHFENISGFRSIKLRVLSICDMTNIDIGDEYNGSVFIQITKLGIKLQNLLNLNSHQYIREDLSLYQIECDRMYPFWMVQTDSHICFDIGSVPSIDCSGTSLTVAATSPMTIMRIGGVNTNVTYWIGWRCADWYSNCSVYGTDVCVDYLEWSQSYCSVYCGFCFPDSYGQLFVLTLPPTSDSSSIKTMSLFRKNSTKTTLPNVGIGVSSKNDLSIIFVLSVQYMRTVDNETFPYQLISVTGDLQSSNIFLYTDEDVRLVVDYKLTTIDYPTLIYSVEPVDTASTEYMTSFFQSDIMCNIISHDGVAVMKQIVGTKISTLGTVDANGIFTVDIAAGDTTGTIFQSNIPITVFCGNLGVNSTWQQLRPTSTWGKRYTIPPVHEDIIDRVALRVITNIDYTAVRINSDYDQDFLLRSKGDYQDIELQKGLLYTVNATRTISVGVLYQKVQGTFVNSSWIILPPELNFVDEAELFMPIPQYDYDSVIVNTVNSSHGYNNESFTTSEYIQNAVYHKPGGTETFMMGRIMSGYLPLYISSTTNLKDLTQTQRCQLTGNNAAGDSLDNDCDGLIDEDVCYTGYGAEQAAFAKDECDINTQALSNRTSICSPSVWSPALQCKHVTAFTTFKYDRMKHIKDYNAGKYWGLGVHDEKFSGAGGFINTTAVHSITSNSSSARCILWTHVDPSGSRIIYLFHKDSMQNEFSIVFTSQKFTDDARRTIDIDRSQYLTTSWSDLDIDGGFGEDCQTETIGSPVYSPPDEPMCIVNISKSGCWRVCTDCLCSWVTNLQYYESMTNDQQTAYNKNITNYIISNLTVDKDSLSSGKAKKESTADDRTSSQSIGYVGYFIFVAVISMFVVFDMTRLVHYFRRVKVTSS